MHVCRPQSCVRVHVHVDLLYIILYMQDNRQHFTLIIFHLHTGEALPATTTISQSFTTLNVLQYYYI